MKRTEFYLKLDVNGIELNPLELEQIFYQAIRNKIGRDISFPFEDIVIIPIEFYEKPQAKYEFKQHSSGGKTLTPLSVHTASVVCKVCECDFLSITDSKQFEHEICFRCYNSGLGEHVNDTKD